MQRTATQCDAVLRVDTRCYALLRNVRGNKRRFGWRISACASPPVRDAPGIWSSRRRGVVRGCAGRRPAGRGRGVAGAGCARPPWGCLTRRLCRRPRACRDAWSCRCRLMLARGRSLARWRCFCRMRRSGGYAFAVAERDRAQRAELITPWVVATSGRPLTVLMS